MMPSLKGNILCAVDVETTGLLAGYHEIIQIAAVPLNQHLEPSKEHRFFYLTMAPECPERINDDARKKHKISDSTLQDCVSQSRGIDLFEEWFNKLDLPFGKRLVPLAHNWAFERAFLIHWLGMDSFNDIWHVHPRDTMITAAIVNDLCAWHGKKFPFNYFNLTGLCRKFDIPLDNAHDALADCIATAKLYASFMRLLYS
jgi:DNA polymerase III epsilon subunit-like protein